MQQYNWEGKVNSVIQTIQIGSDQIQQIESLYFL